MTLNGKRDGFAMSDFKACARTALIKRGRAEAIIEEVRGAVARWPEFAATAGVSGEWAERIRQSYRLASPGSR
jgi:serine/threonine-protein kinase HipA